MWLFYAMNNGYIPMSNDGQMKVSSSIRTQRAIEKLATNWLGNRRGCVLLDERLDPKNV